MEEEELKEDVKIVKWGGMCYCAFMARLVAQGTGVVNVKPSNTTVLFYCHGDFLTPILRLKCETRNTVMVHTH